MQGMSGAQIKNETVVSGVTDGRNACGNIHVLVETPRIVRPEKAT